MPSAGDLRKLAYDVADWSEQQPFALVSEHDATIEEYSMRGWIRGGGGVYFDYTTGSWMYDKQDLFATRRHEDPVFRDGERTRP